MGSCKRQRSSKVLDRATCSPSIEECLPQEMLEAILGKLDRETLCTACLVSKSFCAAASANISTLTLRSPSQAVSLERFPRLGRVRVHHNGDGQSLAELNPCLRAVVTQLTVSQGNKMMLSELPEMPKLRELDVETYLCQMVEPVALHRLTSLEVLKIPYCTPIVAMTITAMIWLTSLLIGRVTVLDSWESVDFSWLQHATNLRKLQALQITVSQEAMPLIGNLTGLTGFTLLGSTPDISLLDDTCSIAPLSRLSRLNSLQIDRAISESNLAIACSLGSGSLAKLRLRVTAVASADCWRLLARQTALTQLGVAGADLCKLQHMGGLRLEVLQFLEHSQLESVDAQSLDALQRAASLTKLHISMNIEQLDVGVSQALGRLTQLRSLELHLHGNIFDLKVPNFPSALSPLTALTMLQVCGVRLENGQLQALSGLTGLQVLDLYYCHLTDDGLPELAVLTNLRALKLYSCGITSLAPVTNILNPLREARGWPPVDARCN